MGGEGVTTGMCSIDSDMERWKCPYSLDYWPTLWQGSSQHKLEYYLALVTTQSKVKKDQSDLLWKLRRPKWRILILCTEKEKC